MLPKAQSFAYTVEPFDDNFMRHLSPAILGRHILASAELHAEARGFAGLTVGPSPMLWVLSRLVVEMETWPRLGERYVITTWIRRCYRYFTDRCFEVTDASGRRIGGAMTVWAMIDGGTRKPHLLDSLVGRQILPYCDQERPCPTKPFRKPETSNAQPVATRQVYCSDIDENNHVNSIRYIDFALDTFGHDFLATHSPCRIEMAYHSETQEGEILSLCRQVQADGSVCLSFGRLSASDAQAIGKPVCHSIITFRQNVQQNN